MSKGLYFLICIVLVLFLAGNVSAAYIEWDNDEGEGDRLWDTAVNWDTDTVPTLATDDTAIMDATYTDVNNGPIIQDGVDAECGWLEMGYNRRPNEEVVLTMTGGTLTAGGWIDVGGYNAGYFRFDMNGGEVTVIGDGDGTWEGLWLAFESGANVVMNVSGGDLDIFGGLWIGFESDSYALVNMTGGTYNGTYVYIGSWMDYCGAGRLNLHGGTMDCNDFSMGPVSQMDITEGVLTCDTDLMAPNGWLFDPCNDTATSENGDGVRAEAPGYTGTLPLLVEMGRITAYDAPHGEIITDDVNYPAEVIGKRAVVLFDYDLRNAGKTTILAATVDPSLAWNPKPFDGERGVLMPYLSHTGFIGWSAGNGAAGHELYFGNDFDAVDNATPGSEEHVDTKSLEDVNDTPLLKWGHTYYWRVDEVNGGTTWKGDVWTFTIEEGKALDPNPADGQEQVPIEVELDWTPGGEAVSHELYLSSDFDEVNDRSISCSVPGANSYDPGILQLGATYYWAVDEVNTAAEVSPWPGDVWSFKTDDHIVVDYFDSYADTGEMQGVWCDWYCNEDSGAIVYLMTDSNYTYDDGNSMRFEYDNDYFAYSNAYAEMADLGISSNWLARGAEALHLVFMGDSDNQVASGDSMYVSVEDADGYIGMVEYHDINDLQDDSWHEWHIDFEELMSSNVYLDLTDVSRIYLDISGSSTGYEVYFDNIGLWSPYCRWDISRPHGDLDGDCDTDSYDMGIMAQTWLMTDSEAEADPPDDLPWVWYKFDEGTGDITYNSGGGGPSLNGTFENPSDPSWDSDGAPAIDSEDPNYSLYFDGQSDNVEIPVLDLNSNTVTISSWIKRNGSQISWAGIVFSRDKDTCAGLSIGENLDLKYHWNGDNWWWDSGLIVPDDEWVFAALVVEPTQAMMYMSDGITYSMATNILEHDTEEFNGFTYVGQDAESGSANRFFEGRIDDVRIYTRALDLGELMGLSGLTGMHYVPLDVPSNIIVKDPPGGPYNEGNKDIVNLRDYAAFADGWLGTVLWP